MAVSYIYNEPPSDLLAKLAGQTGLTPICVKTAYPSEVCVNFDVALDVDQKAGLDEFMSTRGLVFDRTDATATTTAAWDGYMPSSPPPP